MGSLRSLNKNRYPDRKHTFFECGCGDSACKFCGGGLLYCTKCYGAEGSLTTHCCGRPLTEEEEHRIYDLGNLNFRDGEWRDEPNYPRQWQNKLDKT